MFLLLLWHLDLECEQGTLGRPDLGSNEQSLMISPKEALTIGNHAENVLLKFKELIAQKESFAVLIVQ